MDYSLQCAHDMSRPKRYEWAHRHLGRKQTNTIRPGFCGPESFEYCCFAIIYCRLIMGMQNAFSRILPVEIYNLALPRAIAQESHIEPSNHTGDNNNLAWRQILAFSSHLSASLSSNCVWVNAFSTDSWGARFIPCSIRSLMASRVSRDSFLVTLWICRSRESTINTTLLKQTKPEDMTGKINNAQSIIPWIKVANIPHRATELERVLVWAAVLQAGPDPRYSQSGKAHLSY